MRQTASVMKNVNLESVLMNYGGCVFLILILSLLQEAPPEL